MLLFIVKLSTSKCFFALVTHTQLTFCFLAFEREGKTYRYMKSAPFVYQSPSQGPIAFSSTHGILVPSSHFLPLNASLRAHCILAYQLNSRASFAFSCSHCIHACPLYSYAPITFLCNHCIPVRCAHCTVACPLHPCTPIAFSCAMHSRAPITFSCAHCILTCPLHPYTPIAFSCLIHSRAPIAFRCAHSIIVPLSYPGALIASLVQQLHSCAPIAFSHAHCILLHPRHSLARQFFHLLSKHLPLPLFIMWLFVFYCK